MNLFDRYDTNFKELALKLAKSEKEKEVIKHLKEANLWKKPESWRYYGDRENNFGEIGNQQSDPAAALVEKITNSIDAKLMAEVLAKNIDPESDNAPQSITKAQEEFFNITSGNLANLTARERTTIAKNIALVASGDRRNPNYSIIDKGEGQTPAKMPKTILSLGKSNKLRIPFVQGKFNMGGTGSLQFCGERNLQLVISKRNPAISDYENDPTKDKWGFTVVRREDPKEGMKNSTFTYLAPKGKIPSFEADSIPLWPGDHPNVYSKPFKWGTFIKLYEYDMTGMKTNILFGLYNYLSLLLPKVALPIRLYERRDYGGKSPETTLSGLSVRLEEDKNENLVNGFPTYHKMNVLGQTLKTHVYAFKKDAEENYKNHEGVLFTINGQTHGYFKDRFFGRKNVGMDYIKKSLLVIVDCSDLDGRIREDTFMNSRDRLRNSDFRKKVERELEKVLNKHPGLRELREKRKRQSTRKNNDESKRFEEALSDILKKSPTFSKLFVKGDRLSNPFNLEETKTKKDHFEEKLFPDYFQLIKEHDEDNPKEWHLKERCRVKFKTNAENNYFGRDKEPGEFKLYLNGEKYENYSLNLWKGKATLNLTLPAKAAIGDIYKFRAEVIDLDRIEPFVNEFYTEIRKERKNSGGGKGKRKGSSSGEGENDDTTPTKFALPEIIEIRKEDWEEYNFTKESALYPIHNGESYDFYINMDNIHLLTEKKHLEDIETDILDNRYKYGMTLIGMSLLKDIEEEEYTTEKIRKITKEISTVLLPMFNALSEM